MPSNILPEDPARNLPVKCCPCFVSFVIFHHNHRMKLKESYPLCQKLYESRLILQQVVYYAFWRDQSYFKESTYYIDLACVKGVFLLLIMKFIYFCIGFLKIVLLISIVIYEICDLCLRTDIHTAETFPGRTNIGNPKQKIWNIVKTPNKIEQE